MPIWNLRLDALSFATRMSSRREFLKRLLVASAYTLPGKAVLASPVQGGARKKKVLVLGAGIAGLAAALELVEAGHDVTVLEARARPGGRVLTIRQPFSDGQYAEAGATFVTDLHDLTIRYCQRFGLPLIEEPWHQDLTYYCFLDGKRTRAQDLKRGLKAKYTKSQLALIGDPHATDWPPAAALDLDKESWGTLLRRQGATTDEIHQLALGYAGLLGEGLDSYSALAWLRQLALDGRAQKLWRIQGGSDRLPRALAAKLGNRIRYGVAVTSLVQDDSSVTAYCETSENQTLTLKAERAICTLSFSLLRNVVVHPAFSAEKTKAIAELAYTSVARVLLQFRQRYWETQKEVGAGQTDLAIQAVYDETATQPGPRGILSSYTAGARARAMSALDEQARLSLTMREIEKLHSGLAPFFEVGTSKCWDDDPWSRGDYCYFKPGQLTSIGRHVATPEHRIHFAGDHTSRWPGFMQGALESALRVSNEVAATQ